MATRQGHEPPARTLPGTEPSPSSWKTALQGLRFEQRPEIKQTHDFLTGCCKIKIKIFIAHFIFIAHL